MQLPPCVVDVLGPLVSWAQAHPYIMTWLWAGSLAAFVGTILLIPMMVVRMPQDYFLYDRADLKDYRRQHPVFRLFSVVLKNILGAVFIVAGIVMLFLPGQGILTILVGVSLVSFPRKRALEIRLIRRPSVLRAVNWIRTKAGREPLILPPGIRVDRDARG